MRKTWIVFLFCLVCSAQVTSHAKYPRNDVGIFAMGNFNPVSYISIQNTPHTVVSSNKSSLGGSAEYRRYLNWRNAIGISYAQNPSDGKLYWNGQNYIWPLMRYETTIIAIQQLRDGAFRPFLVEGVGVIVTNGYSNSGWSANFVPLVAGVGADYRISAHFDARVEMLYEDAKQGCYDGKACHDANGVVQNAKAGVVWRF